MKSTPHARAPSPPPHAGVHFPPPFIYVGGLVAGWAIERARPWPLTHLETHTRWFLAALFAVGWLAIFLGAFLAFRRARTTLIPNRPASAIVTAGPYRWTRNPMYVSLAFLYLSIAILRNSAWSVLLLPLVLVLVDRFVIAREERYLSAAFPAEYGAYRARVRRWV